MKAIFEVDGFQKVMDINLPIPYYEIPYRKYFKFSIPTNEKIEYFQLETIKFKLQEKFIGQFLYYKAIGE